MGATCCIDELQVPILGKRGVPVEVIQFGWKAIKNSLQASLGLNDGDITRREEKDGTPVVTDNSNFLLDCVFKDGIPGAKLLDVASNIINVVGVVEHGLFLDMATKI